MLRLLFSLLIVTSLGCGASALDRQVSAANLTRVALDLARDSVLVVCDPQRISDSETPPETASRCLKAIEGHDTSRVAWDVWATAIIMSEGDEEALALAWGLAGPILIVYGELSEFLAEFGVDLPSLNFGGE